VQDAALVAETQRNSFTSARELEAGLRAQYAAVKDVLTNENKLYHLSFSEWNVGC
jgi:hypothetical protein